MVDPVSLNSKKEKKNRKLFLTFILALAGGLLGGFIFVAVDLLFFLIGPIFILSGIGSYVLYIYFISEEYKNRLQVIPLILGCICSVALSTLIDILLYSEIFDDTVTIKNAFDSNGTNVALAIPLYSFLALLGMLFTWFFLSLSIKRWNKKHAEHTTSHSYGYSSKAHRTKGKRK